MSEEQVEYMVQSAPRAGTRLGARLRGLRRSKHLTLLQVSEATGVSLSFLSNIEVGNAMPSVDTLETLAAFYDVTVGDLFPDNGDKGGERMPTEGCEDVDPFIDAVLGEVGGLQRAKGLAHYGQPLRTWDGRDVWREDTLPEYHDLGRFLGKAMMQYRDLVAENTRLKALLVVARSIIQVHTGLGADPADPEISFARNLVNDISTALKESRCSTS